MKTTLKITFIIIAAWSLGHWMGYWYGRTRQLYESGKEHHTIPAEMTWSQFLERKPDGESK